MENKKLSKEKAEQILRELERRKGINKVKYKVATMTKGAEIIGSVAACTDCNSLEEDDIIGNVSACANCDDDSGTEGGAGNMSGCADDVC